MIDEKAFNKFIEALTPEHLQAIQDAQRLEEKKDHSILLKNLGVKQVMNDGK